MNGLGDVPDRLRDAVRDASGGLRAVPYLWSPQLLLARRSVFGEQPPTSLRALFSQRGAARAALPDSPLELALAARYLGIGDAFALDRDELAAAREVVAPAQPAAAPLLRCRRAALALPARRDRPRARQPGDARRPARERRRERAGRGHDRDRARARHRRGHPARGLRAARRRRAARTRRAGAAGRRARPRAGARGDLRRAFRDAPARRSSGRSRRRSRTAPWPSTRWLRTGVTGWPEWVGEWVLLQG